MEISTRAKIGFVTFFAALILAGIVVWKGDIFLKASGYKLVGSFKNVGGLLEGADVRYRGYKVGKVLKIIPGAVDSKVHMNIAGGIKVPNGSKLRVAFDGLIGQKFVEVVPSMSPNMLKPGSEIKGFSTLGLVDFIDVGTVNLEELRAILESVRKITDDPETQRSVKEALINLESVVSQLNTLVTEMNEVMQREEFDKAITALSESAGMIVKVGERLDSITKAVDEVTSDPEFSKDIKGTAREAKLAMEELKNAASDIRKTLRKLVR